MFVFGRRVKTTDDQRQRPGAATLFKRVLGSGLLVLVSLGVTFAISETFLWKYEETLLQQAHIDPDSPVMDNWFMSIPDKTLNCGNAFQWDERGDSLIHTRSKDRKLVYEMRPNAAVGEIIKINSLGFRDREFSAKKPEDVYRILVVGDSATFGWDQAVGDTYPKVLERLLNSTDGTAPHYEVLNLGVVGYDAEQEMELIKTRALNFQPDLILIGFAPNDSAIGADGGLWRHFTRGPSRTWDFLKLRGAMIVERFRKEGVVERSYREIVKACAERHVPVVVAFFPALWVAYPHGNFYQANETMQNLCARLGLTALDLFPAFQAADASMGTGLANKVLKGGHPTVLGHRIAAEEIHRFLKGHVLQSSS
jgi:lysophospholipase L1-like esterase